MTVCADCGEREATDSTEGVSVCWECWRERTRMLRLAEMADEYSGIVQRGGFEEPEEPLISIRFVSPVELRASVPPEPPWIWGGYIARGAVTVLAGKPKAGKSTLG